MRSSRSHTFVSLAAAAFLVVAACSSGDDEPTSSTTGAPSDTAAGATTLAPQPPAAAPDTLPPGETPYDQFRAAPTACDAERPDPVTPMTFELPEDERLDLEGTVLATIETSCGDITVELEPSRAPLAVNSFVFLARQDFYDGIVAHRIMPGFMFQAGDQTASGGGDAGYRILLDEFPGEGFTYERGVVAMANAGPGTTGSQFFIMFDEAGLPPNYTVIGRVVDGDAVLDDIASIPVTENARGEPSLPLESLYIEDIVIEE